jgi:hypothetical protein
VYAILAEEWATLSVAIASTNRSRP